MKFFLKYLCRAALEKKGRSLLLIITIAITTGLFITTLGAADIGINEQIEQSKRTYGNYDIILESDMKSVNPLVEENIVDKNKIKEFLPIIQTPAYLTSDEETAISIQGINNIYYDKLPNIQLIEGNKENVLKDNNIIISQKISQERNLEVGDEIEININDINRKFRVAGISINKGMFSQDLENRFSIIVNENEVWKSLGIKNGYNEILMEANSSIDKKKFISEFNDKNFNASTSLALDEEKLKADSETVNLLFGFMIVILSVMSSFIIYSLFKIIIIERIPVIGTFLSQGATRFKIVKILLLEALMYGIVGGLLGLVIGIGLNYGLADMLNEFKQYGIETYFELNTINLIIGFCFALILPSISSLIPILSTRKQEVKDIILNTISIKDKTRGIVSLIVRGIIGFIEKLFGGMSINIRLALNDIKTSKILINNIKIIIISIVAVVAITSLSSSYKAGVIGMGNDNLYDIDIVQGTNPKKVDEVINTHKDITWKSPIYVREEKIDDMLNSTSIIGIEPKTYSEFEKYWGIEGDRDEFYNMLNSDENKILISKQLAESLNKNIGDNITVNSSNGKIAYKITGLFDRKATVEQVLINKENMKRDFNLEYPDDYSIRVNGNVESAKVSLEEALKGTKAVVTTKDDQVKQIIDSVKILFDTLMFFSLMTMLIGILGIINNISVSFIQRKKDFAVLESIGMSKESNGKVIRNEGILIGIISVALGSIVSAIIINILGEMLNKIKIPIELVLDYKSLLIVGVAIILILSLWSLIIRFKNSKLSVIEELRYE